MKRRIYDILSVSHKPGDLSWFFDLFLITLIILNVVAIILESIQPIRVQYSQALLAFEIFSVVIFTIEYVLRVWTANLDPNFRQPVKGNIRFALTPMAIIDLLAFFPFYLPFFGLDFRFLRILRIFRLFRLFKIARYVQALSIINTVFRKKKEELAISLILTILLLLITSTIMYHVEVQEQPENFSSIPHTMWWGIATLTTVGYGDIYPVTGLGKLFGGAIAIIGIGLFALPTGILASGFSDELSRKKKRADNYCPTCGQEVPKTATDNNG